MMKDLVRRVGHANVRAAILVPTRNRPALAAAAVQSVLAQLPASVEIAVSDNSTNAADREDLRHRCEKLAEGRRVRRMYPPKYMSMADHWAWALDQLLAETDATHVAILTDRMVFKPRRLSRLLEVAAKNPNDVISYNHDMVDDHCQPVALRLAEWSGLVVRINSDALIRMGSQAESHPSLPRMMNCLVPVTAFEDIRARFGSIFGSISPDHCFAYRYLAVRKSLLYFDEPLLVHYALDRSNGASYARGIVSEDSADFARRLGSALMNERAPVPEFHTIMNAVVNEYCYVREELSGGFPPIDMPSYLDTMEVGISEIEDPELRNQMRELLRAQDRHQVWRRRPLKLVRHLSRLARTGIAHPTRFAHRVLERGARVLSDHASTSASPVAQWLDRLGLLTGWAGTATFTTVAEAIDFACRRERPSNARATHLLRLVEEDELRRSVRNRMPS